MALSKEMTIELFKPFIMREAALVIFMPYIFRLLQEFI